VFQLRVQEFRSAHLSILTFQVLLLQMQEQPAPGLVAHPLPLARVLPLDRVLGQNLALVAWFQLPLVQVLPLDQELVIPLGRETPQFLED